LLGLVVASLIAAYMSTISTHLNWGRVMLVNDSFWKRVVSPKASERELFWIGRLSTVLLMIIAAVARFWLENALQAFQILLQIGAGTDLVAVHPALVLVAHQSVSELTAMIVNNTVESRPIQNQLTFTGFRADHSLPENHSPHNSSPVQVRGDRRHVSRDQ
jgi:Na+/proline symporter